jgi:hypothetical protein
MTNPYVSQQTIAFWSRAVSRNFSPETLIDLKDATGIFDLNDRVVSAGSCFASNLIPWIEEAGLEYVRTEELPLPFQALEENLGYRNFSAGYGNIYTARHLRQLYEECIGIRKPVEDRWHIDGKVIDPFRPGLAYPATTDHEFDLLRKQHLSATAEAFHSATVFVFTLGLTEAWQSSVDGSVFPACPGTITGTFEESAHEFVNFTVDDVVEDMVSFIELVRQKNPALKFVITVSPVPLVATATDSHVLVASTYSKSVLRVAAERICNEVSNVIYFPAFEIITGPQAPFDFFERDRRNVSQVGVAVVMGALLNGINFKDSEAKAQVHPASTSNSRSKLSRVASEISKRLSKAECDEAMMDPNL